jgi:hypothetical protein
MSNSTNNPKPTDSIAWNQTTSDFYYYDKAPISANNPYAKYYLKSNDSNKLASKDNYVKEFRIREIK